MIRHDQFNIIKGADGRGPDAQILDLAHLAFNRHNIAGPQRLFKQQQIGYTIYLLRKPLVVTLPEAEALSESEPARAMRPA